MLQLSAERMSRPKTILQFYDLYSLAQRQRLKLLYAVTLPSRAQALHVHTPGAYSSFYTKIYSLSVAAAANSYGKNAMVDAFLFFPPFIQKFLFHFQNLIGNRSTQTHKQADGADLAIEMEAEEIWCSGGFATLLKCIPASGAGESSTVQL